jgi:transposase
MSYVRYKIVGSNKYAYKITAYWDSQLKHSKQKTVYLGVVDSKGNILPKSSDQATPQLLLDFGDGYLLNQFIKRSDIFTILEKAFGKYSDELIPLIAYRLCMPSAMYNASQWFEGNILSKLYPNADLSSQKTSKILAHLSREDVQRSFFKEYLSMQAKSKQAIIIDATSLPNQIYNNFNAWGYSDGSIEKQFRFLCVADQKSKTPLFYRYLPGNLSDVTSLQQTIAELANLGINNTFTLIDAGYFSQTNIDFLYENKIDFLTRLPASRKLYKELIKNFGSNIENVDNTGSYGKRGLFIKREAIDIYGHPGFAYLVLDPVRKGKEVNELLLQNNTEKLDKNLLKQNLDNCGVMILVSSAQIVSNEVVECYYLRQIIEQIFGFFKDDLDSLPIRRHCEETIKGYLFLQFIALIFFIQLRKNLKGKLTVEQALLCLRNLKCKLYSSHFLVAEAVKKQKEIFKLFNILVPKKCGI